MSASSRVTLRQIAEKTGYHFTTVSLALRDHHSIAPGTRKLISETAARMGYRPDPALSALVAYRHSTKKPLFSSTLAWVCANEKGYHWKEVPLFCEYYAGAREQSEKLGHKLEPFDLNSPGMTPRRAQQILESRGITGLLIAPFRRAGGTIPLEWGKFCAVTFGYTLRSPKLHIVSNNHFRMMLELLSQVKKRGYRRPGLVLLQNSTERVENKWIAAFLSKQFLEESEYPIPPLLLKKWSSRAFDRWREQSVPDILVTGSRQLPQLMPHLSRKGIRVPEDLGVVDYNLSAEDNLLAGMKQDGEAVGRTAVSVLSRLIHNNERGALESDQIHTLIDGYWHEGPSILPAAPKACS